MATHIEEIYADLLLALRTAHTYVDLSTASGTQRVIIDGYGEMPISPPWLVLGPPEDLFVEVDEIGHRHYRATYKIQWRGVVAAGLDNPYTRTLRAAELADDVIRAVNTAWTTTDGTYTYIHQCTRISHKVPHISGGSSGEGLTMAEAQGEIEIEHSSLDGI